MTIWLTLGFLAVTGMILTARRVTVTGWWRLAMSAVLLALATLCILGPATAMDSGELAQHRMARGIVALLLGVSALTWPETRRPGHHLLALFGSVLLVTANALPALLIGLLVLASARGGVASMERRHALGLASLAVSVVLVYAGTGTLHLDALGAYSAAHAGPLRIEVYVAFVSLVLGLALALGLLGSLEHGHSQSAAPLTCAMGDMMLGAMALLRIGLSLPTLWWEWRWLLGLLALVQAIIALDHWLRLYPEERLHPNWLMTLQGSILLWALAWCQSPEGFLAAVGMVLTLAMATIGFSSTKSGWASSTARLVLLLSLGGLPASLGFRARMFILHGSGLAAEEWTYWLILASLALPLIAYTWGAIASWRHVPKSATARGTPGQAVVGLLAAALALLGGILPGPLSALIHWMAK